MTVSRAANHDGKEDARKNGDKFQHARDALRVNGRSGGRAPWPVRRAQPSSVLAAVKVLLATLRSTLTAEAEGWVFRARGSVAAGCFVAAISSGPPRAGGDLRREGMRGKRPSQPSFVSLINVETLIAAEHPIRAIKRSNGCATRCWRR